jgi:hypothetical protein
VGGAVMATILNATTSSGLVATADNSGIVQLQSNGTNTINVATTGLTTIAYNGANAGLVPGQQFYALSSGYVGSNSSSAQSMFGVGVTLSGSTQYAFETNLLLSKTAGSTAHTLSFGFGGTGTLNNLVYLALYNQNGNYSGSTSNGLQSAVNQTTATVVTNSIGATSAYITLFIKGVLSVNTGGTFIPQYTLSAAPGGAYTTNTGSYFLIYPLGASGSNISVGTWA